MLTIESLRLKFRNKIYIPLTSKVRGNKLKHKNFTIISNNCWGGTVFEAHNLPKLSPTVGMFFMAEDYIKLLSNLKEYFAEELTFINSEDSKWKKAPELKNDKKFGTYPVGKLKDIEIFFLHYDSEQEAKDKWNRRIQRINWEKLLVKFNDQNGCTIENIQTFMKLPFQNKLLFTCKEWTGIDKEKYIVIKQYPKYDYVTSSHEPFGKSKVVDITEILNSL